MNNELNKVNDDGFKILTALAILAGLFKIIGGVIYSSKAVTVDAATSIGNILAIGIVNRYYKLSKLPPDKDHHYGHIRLAFGGDVYTLMIYSFVAGLLTIDLIQGLSARYQVSFYASIYSAIGTVLYAIVIFLSIRIGRILELYSRVSVIELIEGLTATSAALAGAFISYLIDLVGGFGLYLYLIIELLRSSRKLIIEISDRSSDRVLREIIDIAEKYEVVVKSVKVREVYADHFYSDIVIGVPADLSVREAHDIIDKIERRLREKNIVAIIHIEPV
ncbi:MAG: cation transporter dimerization domain-containing protein [Sulfolobales archaeon]